MRLLKLGSTALMFMVLLPLATMSQTLVQLPDVSSETGQTVSIPVVVENFTGVAVFELYIDYSAEFAEFESIDGLSPLPIVNDTNGSTNISWLTTSPRTLSDGDTLLTLNYVVTGSEGESTPLQFTGECYLADQSSHVIPTNFFDGSISIFVPHPPSPFSLITPEDNAVLPLLEVNLGWHSTSIPNSDDIPSYDVWLDINPNLESSSLVSTGMSDTTLTMSDLMDDMTYFWTVHATDESTPGTWASDTLSFSTDVHEAPDVFSLISPIEGDTVRVDSTILVWHPSYDPDPYDIPHYDVWVDTLIDFSTSVLVADSLEDTTFVLNGILDDQTYYWTVRATDSNSAGKWASDTLMFNTSIPHTPSIFQLLTPPDSTVISYEPPFDIEFSWSSSIDPDPTEDVHYTFWGTVSAASIGDTTLSFTNLQDTSYTINLPDSLNLEVWPDSINVQWYVDAIAGGDTVHSEETWLITFMPALNVDGETMVIPESFEISSIYPNPFNPSTTIAINLPHSADLRLEAYNIMGQRVAVVHQGNVDAGLRKFVFDGSHRSSGNYFIVATTASGMKAGKKIVLLK